MTEIPNPIKTFLDGRVEVAISNITHLPVDAIVNAANYTLLGGGGVDGAIHRAGGPDILAECRELRRTQFPDGLPTGEAVATTAGAMTAKIVIHTVGPIYGRHQGKEPLLLANCYRNSLNLAAKRGMKTIAFPTISTGVYGYPKNEAAPVVSEAIENSLSENNTIEKVLLVFVSESDANKFLKHQRFSQHRN